MKRFLLFAFSTFTLVMNAETFNVEVGGNQDITPYFLPQNFSISQGDIVIWTWVSGQHNLLTTSAPEPFDSGSHVTPFTYQRTFDVPGIYEYECDLFNHANTQFGTITVLATDVDEIKANLAIPFTIYPNPALDNISIEKKCACPADIAIYDLTGKKIAFYPNVIDLVKRIDIVSLSSGIYFVEMNVSGNASRKRLIVK